jgi:hypothetical protein
MDTQICVNCITAANKTDGYGFLATGTSGHYNNASSDDTAGGTNSHINHTFTFVSTTDFHLQSGDVGARGLGIGPSSNGAVPTTDIDGTARSGTTCDIGADEYASSLINIVCMII